MKHHRILLLIWALTASFTAYGAPVPAKVSVQVPAKVKFTTTIDSPTSVRLCGGWLWSSSAKTRILYSLNPSTGAIKAQTPLHSIGADGHVLSMGCTGKSLLIGMQKRTGSSQRSFALYQAPILKDSGKLAQVSAITMPGSDLIRDVFCRGNTNYCFLIREKVYKTSNLKTWQLTNVPLSGTLQATNTNLKENPFANWLDQFIIAPGQYFRGGFLDDSLYLLDPLRVSVSTFSLRDEAHAVKWGRWGVWEGQMMSPKGIALLHTEKEPLFAISDVGLKLLFVYSAAGQYLGSLGADGAAERFNYPLDLASSGTTLFVADFGKSKITALDLDSGALVARLAAPRTSTTITKDTRLEELLRPNFFRDPEVIKGRARTRCLTCHDGLKINSLDKFMEQGKHHPINVSMRAVKIDLPLENGTLVTCSSCHDAHHGISANSATGKASKTHPHMLRKPVEALCNTCHVGRSNPATNHPVMNPAEACADCHTMHVSQDFLLKDSLPNMCYECHGTDKKPGAHPFSPEMITCVSCHSLHDSNPALSFATHSQFATTGKGDTQATCLMCHEDKKSLIGKNYHLGTEPQNTHKWPKDEGMCLDCHKPHAKAKPDIRKMCSECHGEIKGQHPVPIAIADTPQGQGIVLANSKVGCMTCHDPHGATPPTEEGRSFFRPKAKLLEFCAACHGDKANSVYENFHKGLKEKKK